MVWHEGRAGVTVTETILEGSTASTSPPPHHGQGTAVSLEFQTKSGGVEVVEAEIRSEKYLNAFALRKTQ
jgi:hypothetical protein